MKAKQKAFHFRTSLESWQSREGMEGHKIESQSVLVKQNALRNDGHPNENLVYKSQIGLVYLKPMVRYAVTLYLHPREKLINDGMSGHELESTKDAR